MEVLSADTTYQVCAIYTNDEERCVSIARHLMRDGVMSDSNRMFALLSKLCQSPISWYTSGPAQKFILRQIRSIDNSYEQLFSEKFEEHDAGEVTSSKLDMDVCLLMLYGHILFTSTSYTYAISTFQARQNSSSGLILWQATFYAQDHSILRTQWSI